MLSSQVKFSADRQTDIGKTICPQSIDARAKKGENAGYQHYRLLLCFKKKSGLWVKGFSISGMSIFSSAQTISVTFS